MVVVVRCPYEKTSSRLFIDRRQVLQSSRENTGSPQLCTKHNGPQKGLWKPQRDPFHMVYELYNSPMPSPTAQEGEPKKEAAFWFKEDTGQHLSGGQCTQTPHTVHLGLTSRRKQQTLFSILHCSSLGQPNSCSLTRIHPRAPTEARNSLPWDDLHTFPFSHHCFQGPLRVKLGHH